MTTVKYRCKVCDITLYELIEDKASFVIAPIESILAHFLRHLEVLTVE